MFKIFNTLKKFIKVIKYFNEIYDKIKFNKWEFKKKKLNIVHSKIQKALRIQFEKKIW